MQEVSSNNNSSTAIAKVIYVLYLVGIAIGISGVIGVIMAYIYKSDAPAWLQTHYRFQIRTFWIGLLYLVLGGMLMKILIGWLLLLFWLVWIIIRCVKGMKSLDAGEAYPEVESWMF